MWRPAISTASTCPATLTGGPGVGDLRNDRQSRLLAHPLERVEALLADPRELIGPDSLRSEPRAEQIRPRRPDRAGDLDGARLRLDTARTGDHDRIRTAHRHPTDLHDGFRRVHLAADQLERLGDGDAAGDPGKPDQERRVHRTPIPGDADRGPVGARDPERA